ncbi:MAG: Ribose operon repressor [uncultured Truepera sp.]|uniref:Ribose operon repressor n=1 Tax=uncultured Truepera sp. TaxID=543023 RepID=A0A6J4UK18_9DEIN|nr:MAG: Ribose operon repressor [uncultured Truepera sp.]
MADVARAAGVSKQTVSRVLNGTGSTSAATTAHIERLIRDLGYRPSGVARSLATNSSLTLGLIVPALDNPYYAEVAQGAELAAWEGGYNLLLSNVFHDSLREEAALRSLQDRGADGVILDTPRLPDARLFALLDAFKAAVVTGRTVPPEVAGSIVVDDAAGITLALRRLAAAGRRRIAFLAAPERFASSRVRREAFVRAETERGTFSPERVLSAEASPEASYQRIRHSGAGGEFDALLCFNDVMAAGALRALHDAGVGVPDEVAVVGHDDIPMAAWLHPPLSTLHISKQALGVSAVRLLLERLGGHIRPLQTVLTPDLTVRGSTGTLPE